MRLRKDVRENLKEPDYWQNVTKPSLIDFLKYRKTKVHEKVDKNNEILRYKHDLKQIGRHYKYGSKAKVVKVAKLNLKDELISSEVIEFWRLQEIQNEVELEQQTDESDMDELISSEEIQNEIEIEQQTDNLDKIKIHGILKKEILVERNVKSIIDAFELYKDNSNDDDVSTEGIMDLTHKSRFVRQLPEDVYKSFLESLNQYDQLIPDETHKFLVDFFSQKLTYKQWSNAVDNLNIKEYKEETTKMIIKIITRSLDNFLQAFALEHMNPLHNIEALEQPHLNDYIHPCIKSALWSCADIYYTSGEIPSINHINRQKGDGVGFTIDSNKYQLVYVEGSRPYKVKASKELDDRNKIIKNLKNMLLNIVKDRVEKRKLIIPDMEVFGVASIKLNIHLYALGFTGYYYIKEIDNATIPRDFSEMEEFIFFYESILKWALSVKACFEKLSDKSLKTRDF
ncbi:3034_t:CDS:10 [Funneliformis mosseae]|uniref:3034_t:CDS:1 n=1 Tax=Funneliformis mosseae TaxID=27381 RepID=A0A9N9GEE9_FUNMO|nr:3034_t:CDS:10 [Funneliformis mosseae]